MRRNRSRWLWCRLQALPPHRLPSRRWHLPLARPYPSTLQIGRMLGKITQQGGPDGEGNEKTDDHASTRDDAQFRHAAVIGGNECVETDRVGYGAGCKRCPRIASRVVDGLCRWLALIRQLLMPEQKMNGKVGA